MSTDATIRGTTDAVGATYSDEGAVFDSVKEYYGKVLQQTGDLKTSACTACGPPPPNIRAALGKVPKAVTEKFYGCGNPVPDGITGLHVMDLGCGSGRDCYVAAQFVGSKGSVTGIDMTDEQLVVARGAAADFKAKNPDAGELHFKQGFIEDVAGAGVANGSINMAISNCVVNLSPNKRLVLQGVYNALADGGEFHFSDVYADRRIPEEARRHELLFGECITGALYINDFISLCMEVGFGDPRQVTSSRIDIHDAKLRGILGNVNFFSITYRLFKLPKALEDRKCEDYGQVATYKGTIPGHALTYTFDDHHTFETHRPHLVCGNTAAMLQNTWLAPYFTVQGNRDNHFGEFQCGGGGGVGEPSAPCAPGGCSGGSCS